MSSALSQVMMWAVRLNSRKDLAPHQVLEIKPDATLDEAQTAFHKIARIAHPDLHRATLSAEDLDTVTTAYSRVAAAYQEFRTHRLSTSRLKALAKPDGGAGAASPAARPASTPTRPAPVAARPAAAGGSTGSQNAAAAMSSKALIYYRKAELSLRRGDLRGAILQLKMAIAADPQSAFLRTALAEVEAEVAKTT